MSFIFNWPRFSDQFHHDAIQMLNNALNKGNKPPVITDKIEVVELEMGTQPPELEIRDIGELTMDQFRGIFRLTYSGDAHLVLKTKVQANPLNHKQPDIHLMTGSRGMLAAKHPLVVPMLLRLSHFKLNSYVVLVVSKQKGITLVFKTDPLQNVDINSTFDSIAVIQKFIQREIEGQLRQMFREDLPGIIHRLSQQWVKAKVQAPYLAKRPPPPISNRRPFDVRSAPEITLQPNSVPNVVGLHPHLMRQQPVQTANYPSPRSTSGTSISNTSGAARPPASTLFSAPASASPPENHTSFPDLENFDPTYGLRPEGLPTKSLFRGFSSLFTPNKGLADLAEEPSDRGDYDDEMGSFDMVDWDDMIPDTSPPPSVSDEKESNTEYETIPAVGGGTITRPRIYHSQSQIQPSPEVVPPSSSHFPPRTRSYDNILPPRGAGFSRSGIATPGILSHTHRAGSLSYFSEFAVPNPPPSAPPYGFSRRPVTPDSMETRPSHSSNDHGVSSESPSSSSPALNTTSSPIYMRHLSSRRPSVSSTSASAPAPLDIFPPTSPPTHLHHLSSPTDPEGGPKIILRPTLNSSIHQLSTLSHSNHTLSPYTRSLEHFTVRSVPPRGVVDGLGLGAGVERQPVKARRKRLYRLGKIRGAEDGQGQGQDAEAEAEREVVSRQMSSSPVPPSETDKADMDLYFRACRGREGGGASERPEMHPTHVRRRRLGGV